MTFPLRSLVLGLALIGAALLANLGKPTQRIADLGPRVELETLIPERFGQWRVDPSVVPVAPAPDVQAKLDRIYNQTLARTYIDAQGSRIMLSVSYGGDQSTEDMQAHRPEFCYASQGFDVSGAASAAVLTDYGRLVVRRLFASAGPRQEPITYWITVGDKATLPGVGRKLAQIGYGLTGKVPDGMLVRVSSLGGNNAMAYALHDRFIRDLLAAVDVAQRTRLAGRFGA